jgi:hypothetical protein
MMHGHRRSFRFVPDQGTWDAAGSGRSGEAPGAKRSGFASWRALVRSDGRGRAPVACCRNPSSRCPGVRRAGAEGKGRAPRVGAGDARTPGVPEVPGTLPRGVRRRYGEARTRQTRMRPSCRLVPPASPRDAVGLPLEKRGRPSASESSGPVSSVDAIRSSGASQRRSRRQLQLPYAGLPSRVGKLTAHQRGGCDQFEWIDNATEASSGEGSYAAMSSEAEEMRAPSALEAPDS